MATATPPDPSLQFDGTLPASPTNIDWNTPLCFAHSITNGRVTTYDHLVPLDLALTTAAHVPNSRVIVELPPRHGKSTLTSIYYPTWYRCRWPRRNIALWSATARLAQRFSSHTRKTTAGVIGPLGWQLDESTKAWENWKIAGSAPAEGEFYAGSVGSGSTMGTGVHLAIIDDYHRNVQDALSQTIRENQHDWYLACVKTRLEPGASVVIVATRWHRDDLIGFVHQEALLTGNKWDVIRLPAISDEGKALWPERYPIQDLREIQRGFEVQGRPWMWQALYQQEPPEVLDSEWDPFYFHDGIYFDEWPEHPALRIVVLDPSVGQSDKADYSAICVGYLYPNGHIYVEADLDIRDVVRQASAVCDHIIAHNASMFACEANGFQGVLRIPYEQECHRRRVIVPFQPVFSHKEKRGRIRSWISPHLAAGRLHFKRNNPGTNLLLEQLRGFPSHLFDDGPDALAMLIEVLSGLAYGQAPQEEYATT